MSLTIKSVEWIVLGFKGSDWFIRLKIQPHQHFLYSGSSSPKVLEDVPKAKCSDVHDIHLYITASPTSLSVTAGSLSTK